MTVVTAGGPVGPAPARSQAGAGCGSPPDREARPVTRRGRSADRGDDTVRLRRWFRLVALIAAIGLFFAACSIEDDSEIERLRQRDERASGDSGRRHLPGQDRRGAVGRAGRRRTSPTAPARRSAWCFDIGGVDDKCFNEAANDGLTAAAENFGVETPGRSSPTRTAPTAASCCARSPRTATSSSSASASSSPRTMEHDRRRLPRHPSSPSSTALVERHNVTVAGVRRGAGLVPGRRGAAAQDRHRQDRLHRRRRDRADPEVPGRLRGRVAKISDGRRGRGELPDPRRDFTGFDDPAKGKTIADGMYADGADVVFHAGRQLRRRRVRGGGRGRPPRHRRRLRPVPAGRRGPAEVHPHARC